AAIAVAGADGGDHDRPAGRPPGLVADQPPAGFGGAVVGQDPAGAGGAAAGAGADYGSVLVGLDADVVALGRAADVDGAAVPGGVDLEAADAYAGVFAAGLDVQAGQAYAGVVAFGADVDPGGAHPCAVARRGGPGRLAAFSAIGL